MCSKRGRIFSLPVILVLLFRFVNNMREIMDRYLIMYLLSILVVDSSAMNKPQVRKAMGIVKNQCMQKNGVTDDLVANIEQGGFIEDHRVMCYITCIYKNLQVLKNDKLSMELISKQVDLLYPKELKEPVKRAIEACVPTQDKYIDTCEGVFYATKCLYEADPSSFIFP